MRNIPDQLGIRYFEMLYQDRDYFSCHLIDLSKSDTLLQRYKFYFQVYKMNDQIFEALFTDPNAPLVENAGEYTIFREQVKSFVNLIQIKLDKHYFSNKDANEIWRSAEKIDDIYFRMTGK